MTAYLTRAEAAERLHCTPNTISKYVHTGQLRASQPGKRLLFTAADIDGFVAAAATRRKRRSGDV